MSLTPSQTRATGLLQASPTDRPASQKLQFRASDNIYVEEDHHMNAAIEVNRKSIEGSNNFTRDPVTPALPEASF